MLPLTSDLYLMISSDPSPHIGSNQPQRFHIWMMCTGGSVDPCSQRPFQNLLTPPSPPPHRVRNMQMLGSTAVMEAPGDFIRNDSSFPLKASSAPPRRRHLSMAFP